MDKEPNQSTVTAQEVEKQEETKLKARYAIASVPGGPPGRMPGGHSSFLQKRLAKGQKYFDSGDYQMAKQSRVNKSDLYLPGPSPFIATGDAIPTPESVSVRKTSTVPSKLSS